MTYTGSKAQALAMPTEVTLITAKNEKFILGEVVHMQLSETASGDSLEITCNYLHADAGQSALHDAMRLEEQVVLRMDPPPQGQGFYQGVPAKWKVDMRPNAIIRLFCEIQLS